MYICHKYNIDKNSKYRVYFCICVYVYVSMCIYIIYTFYKVCIVKYIIKLYV